MDATKPLHMDEISPRRGGIKRKFGQLALEGTVLQTCDGKDTDQCQSFDHRHFQVPDRFYRQQHDGHIENRPRNRLDMKEQLNVEASAANDLFIPEKSQRYTLEACCDDQRC